MSLANRTALASFASLSLLAGAEARVIGDLPRRADAPVESLAGIDTEYGELQVADGSRLRTIVTRPSGRRGRLPAVQFVQWLSCDTVEIAASARDGWSTMLRRLITESGALWQRMDKAGVGDSQGQPCSDLDYETELAHHRAAFEQLVSRPDVDPARVVIFGASMGSNYAPLVAAGRRVAGVVVWGGGAATWFERMLRFERSALELGGTDPASLSAEVTARAEYFSRYLLRGEAPAAIAKTDPDLASVWTRIVGTQGDRHYGRPPEFHQQAQRQSWPAAWANVQAPVLVLFGEHDWFESREAAELIARIVNHARPQTAAFHAFPGLDHHFTRYPTAQAAFRGEGGREQSAPVVETVLEWLGRLPPGR